MKEIITKKIEEWLNDSVHFDIDRNERDWEYNAFQEIRDKAPHLAESIVEEINDKLEVVKEILNDEQSNYLIEEEAFHKGMKAGIIEGQKEERQFILNVLDGIDIADKQMGVIGGTKAIRFALQSRIFHPLEVRCNQCILENNTGVCNRNDCSNFLSKRG